MRMRLVIGGHARRRGRAPNWLPASGRGSDANHIFPFRTYFSHVNQRLLASGLDVCGGRVQHA
ncbi:hypothetical protein XFF6990_10125 [Xanthomonas citri pv. fuscans]|uniref:Uncharacterized protein n=1 Tax=Xanthomonas campestris pv. phaseoli TaxID=317013 RepID=A0A7Z7J392_XANCH|nr:hypothetical protein XFF6990_10125 [Xanthomonas citri pv. fuscans]SOO26532.1 hypothetical protein XFF6991_570097 [Xanthomonas phaseoli pv. phaseoli]